jgi:hypothetical protein
MKYLDQLPVVFVNYTPGSGGWFLASLIQQFINPSLNLTIDRKGSGHANTFIYHINNFYKDYMHSEIGESIIHNTNLQTYSLTDRIEYLKQSVKINNPTNETIVISLHCADLEIFLQAFPCAKFVCININDEHILKCRYNLLYKAMQARPELLQGLAKMYQKDYDQCVQWSKNLTKENLEKFDWIDAEVRKFMPESSYAQDNVMNVDYDNYINGDEIIFLDSIIEFLDLNIDQKQFDDGVASLVTYRFSQPRLPQ